MNTLAVFPARAGMSRPCAWRAGRRWSFPRTRGDEPWAARARQGTSVFSPHARG